MTWFVKKVLTGFSVATLLLAACQSKEPEIVPIADFSYEFADLNLRSDLPDLAGYPVGTAIKLTNKSRDAVAYLWDLGDGNTSTEKEPTVYYKKSGSYTITLTITSSTSTQRVATQSIKILDCVLKKITLNGFKWNSLGAVPSWDDAKKADLTIEIGQPVSSGSPTTVGALLYRSEPVKAITNSTTAFTIPVTQRVILNPDVVNNLLINLYGNDGTGNQLVYTTGRPLSGYAAAVSHFTHLYTILSSESGSGTALALECHYE